MKLPWEQRAEIARKLRRAAKHASSGDAKHILHLAKCAVKKDRPLVIIRWAGRWFDATVTEVK